MPFAPETTQCRNRLDSRAPMLAGSDAVRAGVGVERFVQQPHRLGLRPQPLERLLARRDE